MDKETIQAMTRLKAHRVQLKPYQFKTLKGQILSGNADGAMRGLDKILTRRTDTLGGYIETLTIAEDCCIVCNEEGRLRGLPYNGELLGMEFVGTIMLVGINGDEFASVPDEDIPMLRSTLNRMNEKD